MSYSTRRSTAQSPQQNTVGNIGQRRPVVTNNFVPGGQLSSQKPGGPNQQQQQRAQNAPQQGTNIQFRNQQQQQGARPNQQQQQQQQQQQAAQQQAAQQQAAQQQAAQQQAAQQQAAQQQTEQITMDTTNGDAVEGEVGGKKKHFWSRQGGKITKKEKIRRRNIRLSKILQPKNAVMILNELVKNTSYVVEELPLKTDGNQFKASVFVDNEEHSGYGRSKIHAKNSAAETALKHYIKTNKLGEMKMKDEEGNEKMDVSEEEGAQAPMPWQHFASFALYKLFTSWGEDPNSLRQGGLNTSGPLNVSQPENKPAKKMPANPETINPLMLINQMLPHAKFEEIGKSGDPPNVTFSFRCNVDDQSFIGTGPNKKAAKRLAAFGACHKVLGIQYPTDVYVSSY